MFREKFIANVPKTTLEDAKFTAKKWRRTFNVACWVRFNAAQRNRLGLILKYTDSSGSHTITVDQCETELDTTVLLAAQISLAGKGKVSEMGLYLEVTNNSSPYVVDELYVQHTGKGAISRPKIISRVA